MEQTIKNYIFRTNLEGITREVLKVNPRITEMEVTQIISKMVQEGQIIPVFLHPFTKSYQALSPEVIARLKRFEGKPEWNKIYRLEKKMASQRIKRGQTIAVVPQVKTPDKRSFLRRIFGIK